MLDEEKFIQSRLLSPESILEAVDEYLLYCFYLGYEPELRIPYESPIREEGDPDVRASFSLFNNTVGICEYRWKDSGRGITGDIFTLVKLLTGASSLIDTYGIIRRQMELGFGEEQQKEGTKLVYPRRPEAKGSCTIKVTSRAFTQEAIDFWLSFGISLKTLERYNVTQVRCMWFREEQKNAIYPRGLCFAYRIIEKYKIYQPFDKMFKFCNNYTEEYIEGLLQLPYKSDTLIITKSLKDVMLLHELGYEAVSPRSESTLVHKNTLAYLESKYSKIVILFDNDMRHRGDEYTYPKVYVPLESGTKDLSDYRKKYGHDKTVQLIKQLLK
jgi:hypothetical protein